MLNKKLFLAGTFLLVLAPTLAFADYYKGRHHYRKPKHNYNHNHYNQHNKSRYSYRPGRVIANLLPLDLYGTYTHGYNRRRHRHDYHRYDRHRGHRPYWQIHRGHKHCY